jgi:anaerobic dimethyl sulfoxide reductase subunit B (iron-sulfur subunit)
MAIGFYHDSTVCTECRACQVACKDVKNLKAGENYRKVSATEGGEYPKPWIYFISMACNHCDLPACLGACPAAAISKGEDGAVVIDTDMCIGCKSCITACPYEAPQYLADLSIVGKCDTCIEIRTSGGNPVCVEACNMRCLEFGDIDELKAKHSGENLKDNIEPLPSPDQTSPNFIINAKMV